MACELYLSEMANCIEEDFLPPNTSRKVESGKKKKSKKRKNDKVRNQGEPSLCLSFSPEHHSRSLNDMEKKKKHKKKKNKSVLKDKLALQPSNVPPELKMYKPSHKVIVKSNTGHHPIRSQALEEMSKRAPKAVKYVSHDRVKVRSKKRVLFDLSPKGSVVKTYRDAPQFAISKTTFICPGEEHETYAPILQGAKHCEESLESAEGIDSQDLFITQNTFLSPSLFPVPSDDELTSAPELKLTSQQQPSQELLQNVANKSTAEKATQTENFFTSPERSTFLNFQLNTLTKCTEQPVDLSLPQRQRGQKSMCTIREESDLHHHSKTDLTQLKVVQMRLNESFFFKMKGEKESPKSQCPLMKLEEDYGKKHKK
ncbi:uncharacterized protein LOC121724550 [Alosa sapidissima]|uniref:uncharacterized protein LOC121724550 n=1 Tax=Alosa sapidissima TaxID=34773 RepID=UPI001C0A4CF1|nr:uncharacterized protein LOC121724550 [Alosa sapidissima]XP_041967131.1 uncharacterized protein LOC121724550 [Alosa sapidissima]